MTERENSRKLLVVFVLIVSLRDVDTKTRNYTENYIHVRFKLLTFHFLFTLNKCSNISFFTSLSTSH